MHIAGPSSRRILLANGKSLWAAPSLAALGIATCRTRRLKRVPQGCTSLRDTSHTSLWVCSARPWSSPMSSVCRSAATCCSSTAPSSLAGFAMRHTSPTRNLPSKSSTEAPQGLAASLGPPLKEAEAELTTAEADLKAVGRMGARAPIAPLPLPLPPGAVVGVQANLVAIGLLCSLVALASVNNLAADLSLPSLLTRPLALVNMATPTPPGLSSTNSSVVRSEPNVARSSLKTSARLAYMPLALLVLM